MAMAPAAISASPAVRMTRVCEMAPVRPAASAKGTVSPSDMPMTTSRTASPAVKCFSMCGVSGMVRIPWRAFAIEFPAWAARRRHDTAKAGAARGRRGTEAGLMPGTTGRFGKNSEFAVDAQPEDGDGAAITVVGGIGDILVIHGKGHMIDQPG